MLIVCEEYNKFPFQLFILIHYSQRHQIYVFATNLVLTYCLTLDLSLLSSKHNFHYYLFLACFSRFFIFQIYSINSSYCFQFMKDKMIVVFLRHEKQQPIPLNVRPFTTIDRCHRHIFLKLLFHTFCI